MELELILLNTASQNNKENDIFIMHYKQMQVKPTNIILKGNPKRNDHFPIQSNCKNKNYQHENKKEKFKIPIRKKTHSLKYFNSKTI